MDTLFVDRVEIKKNIVRVKFSFSEGAEIKRYFNRSEMANIYTVNVEGCGAGLAVVPFLCNVLPVIWRTNSRLMVDEVDANFLACIEDIRNGYAKMWPELSWEGSLHFNKAIKSRPSDHSPVEKSMLFFSGGVDATASFIEKIDYQPILLSVLGADIALHNTEKWLKVKDFTNNLAKGHGLKTTYMRSNFRKIVHEPNLNELAPGTSWYQAFQHGIGLSALAAPICAVLGVSKLLISGDRNRPNHRSGSSPQLEGNLRFGGTIVERVHNDISRQDKIQLITDAFESGKFSGTVRVCLNGGLDECCQCEKCTRTILGIIAQGHDPRNFGFNFKNEDIRSMPSFIDNHVTGRDLLLDYYEIQNVMRKKYDHLEDPYGVGWLLNVDFIAKIINNEIANFNIKLAKGDGSI